MKLASIRKQYTQNQLPHVLKSPFQQFHLWLQEAIDYPVVEPTAMVLTTSTTSGVPSSRMVLMKGWSTKGATFFTHLNSRKALELFENPRTTLLFFWKELERQVIIEGTATLVSRRKVHDYFSKRPKKSQAAAWVSPQGQPFSDRSILEEALKLFLQKYQNKKIPTPPFWGGFTVQPTHFQFWQGRENRLHDRFSYYKTGKAWVVERIYP